MFGWFAEKCKSDKTYKNILCALFYNFAQSFLLYIKVEFEPSFLPIGKLGRKISPVDCVITRKNYFFAPKIKFTQTVT